MNNLMLSGRLTKDPELKETESGIKVCDFTIASKRPYTNDKGKVDTDFFDMTVWNEKAEDFVNTYKKGDQVGITATVKSSLGTVNNYKKNIISIKVDKVVDLRDVKDIRDELEVEKDKNI